MRDYILVSFTVQAGIQKVLDRGVLKPWTHVLTSHILTSSLSHQLTRGVLLGSEEVRTTFPQSRTLSHKCRSSVFSGPWSSAFTNTLTRYQCYFYLLFFFTHNAAKHVVHFNAIIMYHLMTVSLQHISCHYCGHWKPFRISKLPQGLMCRAVHGWSNKEGF